MYDEQTISIKQHKQSFCTVIFCDWHGSSEKDGGSVCSFCWPYASQVLQKLHYHILNMKLKYILLRFPVDAIYLSYMRFAQPLLGNRVKIKIMIVGTWSEMWNSIGRHMK